MAEETPAQSTLSKKAVHFVLSVALALLIGKALEIVDRGNIAPLQELQQNAINAVSAFDPWNIFHSYVCNLESAGLGGDRCSPVPQGPEGLNPYATPSEPSHGAGILSPLVAFLAVIWQLLIQPSAIGSLLAMLQFAAAVFLMIWLNRGERKEAPYYLFFFPLGTVGIACVLGWGAQVVMLAGLGLFKWFTDLAGLCCGSGTVGYLGYQFCLKAVEVKATETAEKKILKH